MIFLIKNISVSVIMWGQYSLNITSVSEVSIFQDQSSHPTVQSAFTKKGAFTVSSMFSSHLKQTQFMQKKLKKKKLKVKQFSLRNC